MGKSLLNEILEIKRILAHLIGTTDIPEPQKFSKIKLDKAAKLFKKLKLIDDQWVNEQNLGKYFNRCYKYEIGKFLREEFGFANYFNKGNSILYNKQDIISLAQELKSRNVDLAIFMELRKGQSQLEKKLLDLATKNRDARVKKKQKNYKIPDDLVNIKLSDYKLPDVSIIEKDLENWRLFGYSEY